MPKKKKRFPKTGMPTNAEGIGYKGPFNPTAMAEGQAQDHGSKVTAPGVLRNPRGGKLGYKANYNDFPDLVARAKEGDKQAKKQLRNGKYAFPHLRNFDKLPELKGEMLIDNFISALTTHPKHLYANYKNKETQRMMKQLSVFLKRAHRFTIDDDLLERVLFDSATAQWEKIFDVINGAIPPFDNMWIETQRNSRHFDRWKNDSENFAPEWMGWHIQRGGLIRGYKPDATFPDCLVQPTYPTVTHEDTIVVQKYMLPKKTDAVRSPFRHGDLQTSYFIPSTCYIITNKEHLKLKTEGIETKEKGFWCLGDHWAKEIRDFAPTHIRKNLEKRIIAQPGMGFGLDDYNILMGDSDTIWKNITASSYMYSDDLRMLAWLFSQLNFTWHESKPIGKPMRKNRMLIPSQASIDLKTIEIALPKPRGITLRPDTPSEGGHRKLHWVRAHPRKYRDGRIVQIRPHQRGNAKYGEVIKDYALKLDKGEVDETSKDKN